MNTTIADRVSGLAAGIFAVPRDDLSPTTTPDDIEAWDSLAMLNLVVALEDEFGVELEPADIEDVTSIGDLADLVAARLER